MQLTINFNDFDNLAAVYNKFEWLLSENPINIMLQTYLKKDSKIVSIRALWLIWHFYFHYYMIVRVFLIYNKDFVVGTGRGTTLSNLIKMISYWFMIKNQMKNKVTTNANTNRNKIKVV